MYLYCQNDINPHSSLYRDIMTVPFFLNKYAQPLLADNVTFQADRGSLFPRSQDISQTTVVIVLSEKSSTGFHLFCSI